MMKKIIIIVIILCLGVLCIVNFGKNKNEKEIIYNEQYEDKLLSEFFGASFEEAEKIYQKEVVKCQEVYEDEWIQIQLCEYIVSDDGFAIVYLKMIEKTDEQIGYLDSFRKQSDILQFYETGNLEGKSYSFSLVTYNNDMSGRESISYEKTEDGMDVIYSKTLYPGYTEDEYIFQITNDEFEVLYEYAVKKSDKKNQLKILTENGEFVITPYMLCTYEEKKVKKVRMVYGDGTELLIDNNKYSSHSSDGNRIDWVYNTKIYSIDNVVEIDLDDEIYVKENDVFVRMNVVK